MASTGYKLLCNLLIDSTGTVSQPIWLDYVYCSNSTTSCLAYCQSCPSSQNHNCVHGEDITLKCGM